MTEPVRAKRVPLRFLVREIDERSGRDDLPLLAVTIRSGVVRRDALTEDEPRAYDLSAYKRCRAGDVVLNRMRAFQGALGVAREPGLVSPDYTVLRAHRTVDPRLIAYALASPWGVAEMTARLRGIGGTANGAVRTPRVSFRDLGLAEVPVPSRRTQTDLCNFLDDETARIQRLEQALQTLHALAVERLNAEIKCRIGDIEAIRVPVSRLATYRNGWPFKPDDAGESGLPIVRIRQLTDPSAPRDHFAGTLPREFRIDSGDLIFSWSGSLEARYWTGGPAWLNQHLFRVEAAANIDRRWLRWALRYAIWRFDPYMHGSAMKHITAPMMRRVKVPRPDLREQQRIANDLDAMEAHVDRLVERLQAFRARLREYQGALLTEAVANPIEVLSSAGDRGVVEGGVA